MASFLDKNKDGADKVGNVIPDVDSVHMPDFARIRISRTRTSNFPIFRTFRICRIRLICLIFPISPRPY